VRSRSRASSTGTSGARVVMSVRSGTPGTRVAHPEPSIGRAAPWCPSSPKGARSICRGAAQPRSRALVMCPSRAALRRLPSEQSGSLGVDIGCSGGATRRLVARRTSLQSWRALRPVLEGPRGAGGGVGDVGGVDRTSCNRSSGRNGLPFWIAGVVSGQLGSRPAGASTNVASGCPTSTM
jgi:hypothetical protein